MKKGISIILMASVLLTGSVQSFATTNDKVEKVQQKAIKVEKIKEAEAKDLVLKGFEKYLGTKIESKNLIEKVEFLTAKDVLNQHKTDCWHVSWSTFDTNKLKSGKTKEEIKKLNKEWHESVTYYAVIDAKSYKILEIAIIDGTRTCLKEQEIATEEAKKIALEYIKNIKVFKDVENLEFLGDIRIGPDLCTIAYKFGDDKVIQVFVESKSKKAVGFQYTDEEATNGGLESTVGYKTEGILG